MPAPVLPVQFVQKRLEVLRAFQLLSNTCASDPRNDHI